MMVPTKILPLLATPCSLGHQAPHGPGVAARAQNPFHRPVRLRVHHRALRRRGRGLSGRAAALRHLRRRPRRAQRHRVLPRFVDLAPATAASPAASSSSAPNTPPASRAAPLFRTLKGGLSQLVGAVTATFGDKVEVRHSRAEPSSEHPRVSACVSPATGSKPPTLCSPAKPTAARNCWARLTHASPPCSAPSPTAHP